MTPANLRTRTFGAKGKTGARADEMEAKWKRNGARAPPLYRRPDDRNRETGSATGCLRNTQRATAKPKAA